MSFLRELEIRKHEKVLENKEKIKQELIERGISYESHGPFDSNQQKAETLLSFSVFPLPYSPGQTVFVADRKHNCVDECTVVVVTIYDDYTFGVTVEDSYGSPSYFTGSSMERKVFKTREEAEYALD